jgi:arsenite methyltransferase
VVICVINLSTEKERVMGEAFRVLKPGGRFAVSDVVFLGTKNTLPPRVARSAELWSGYVSGALEESEYEALLPEAGFEEVAVEVTYSYPPEQIAGLSGAEALREVPAAIAFIRARKPEVR